MQAALNAEPLTIHLEDWTHYRNNYVLYEVPDTQRHFPQIEEVFDLGGGAKVKAILVGDHLFIGTADENSWRSYQEVPNTSGTPLMKVTVVGKAHTKIVTKTYRWTGGPARWSGSIYTDRQEAVTQEDCYLPEQHEPQYDYRHDPQDPRRLPYIYLTLDMKFPDGGSRQVEMRFRIPIVGKVTVGKQACGKPKINVEVNVHGFTHTFTEDFTTRQDGMGGYIYLMDDEGPAATLYKHLKESTIVGGPDALWMAFLECSHDDAATPLDNIASVYKRKTIAPNLTRLQTEQPLDWTFFRWLHDATTISGKRTNQLLSAMLLAVGEDYDKLLAGLRAARAAAPNLTTKWLDYKRRGSPGLPVKRAICETLPGVAEKIQDMEAQKDFRKQQTQSGQAEGLGVTADKYPLLRAAIENSNIPIGVFNQPGADGQPVNREFAIWERALGQKGWAEVIYAIAKNAAGRSTYERDITPYLMALFQVPKYLDKHTEGRKRWSAMPKFVESQWDLERDDDEEDDPNGTVKKRSAFTPVADNETRVVEIPYVAVSVTGVRTQWCYSRHFYIFEEGFTDPESDGMVTRDFEPKLNGRDDYGLMYYTLTGTDTARGYPTFLVIFERLASKTRVHFHRVRPCRSKNGVVTPACNLIEACYQYMAGNIPAKDITAQQGDLIFIRCDNDPIQAKAKVAPDAQTSPVLVFESHSLQSLNSEVSLTLHRSTAKTPQNRLGFVWAPTGLKVGHPEHDDIENLPEGWYEIRRCKSWEANPKAIWSMTID